MLRLLKGTETGGSLVYPASKAGVYGMKPTWGSVSTAGAFRISRSFDGIGGMAKTPVDLASLIETILLPEAWAKVPADGYESFMTGSWEGLRIGVVESTWGGANAEKWGSGICVSLKLFVMGSGVNGLLG
jgi:amidase